MLIAGCYVHYRKNIKVKIEVGNKDTSLIIYDTTKIQDNRERLP